MTESSMVVSGNSSSSYTSRFPPTVLAPLGYVVSCWSSNSSSSDGDRSCASWPFAETSPPLGICLTVASEGRQVALSRRARGGLGRDEGHRGVCTSGTVHIPRQRRSRDFDRVVGTPDRSYRTVPKSHKSSGSPLFVQLEADASSQRCGNLIHNRLPRIDSHCPSSLLDLASIHFFGEHALLRFFNLGTNLSFTVDDSGSRGSPPSRTTLTSANPGTRDIILNILMVSVGLTVSLSFSLP